MSDSESVPDWVDLDERSRTVTRDPELVAQVAATWETEFERESQFYSEVLLLINELQQEELLPGDVLRDLKNALSGDRLTVEIVDRTGCDCCESDATEES
jgi:hypothetical protein